MAHSIFGTHPDIPDHRDHYYSVPHHVHAALPSRVDLRRRCPPVYHQGHLNACSAHAIAAAMWFDEIRQGARDAPSPSRLFIYYNERAKERKIHRNTTVSLRDGYKSVARSGACPERQWPYRIHRFDRRPPAECYRAGRERRAVSYHRILHDLAQLKGCLAEGYPFTMGISVYQSFKSPAVARSGRVPMPAHPERQLGGHAVLAVGYDDAKQWFVVRNSWGAGWGLGGYFLLPYAYVLHPGLSWDFWTLRRVL